MSPSIWLMKEGWRRQGQRLNVTAQWCNHLTWDRVSNQSQHDLTSCFFWKTLVVGPARVWTHNLLLLSRTLLSQLLTRQHCLSELKAKVVAHFEVVSKMNKVHSNLNIACQQHLYLTNWQKRQPVYGLHSYTFVAEAMHGNGCSMYIHVQCMV